MARSKSILGNRKVSRWKGCSHSEELLNDVSGYWCMTWPVSQPGGVTVWTAAALLAPFSLDLKKQVKKIAYCDSRLRPRVGYLKPLPQTRDAHVGLIGCRCEWWSVLDCDRLHPPATLIMRSWKDGIKQNKEAVEGFLCSWRENLFLWIVFLSNKYVLK